MELMRSEETLKGPAIPGMVAVAMAVAALSLGCPDDVADTDLEADDADEVEVDVDVDVDLDEPFAEQTDYSRPDYAEPRNPFEPDDEVFSVDEVDELDDGVERALGPLEQYAIASLDLVTIISETAVPRAMFVDPTGMGHFAMEGDRIGEEGGVVSDIRPNEVEIEYGDDRTSRTTVELREREIRTARADELTEEEREVLRRLMDDEEARRAVEEEFASDEAPDAEEFDERFPGLAPPGTD